MYRADPARAGFRLRAGDAPAGASTARQVVSYGLALVPVSLLPTLVGLTGAIYFAGALVLGLAYLAYGLALGRARSSTAARRLVRASVLYLPLLFGLMALDRAVLLR
jgi:protoheme IX farnesyltransferase